MDLSQLGITKENTETFNLERAEEENAKRREIKYRADNRDRLAKQAAYASEWRRKNPDRYKATRKAYAENNKEKIRAKINNYYAANRAKRTAQARLYRARKPLFKERQAEYRAKNRERLNAQSRDWWKSHPEKQLEKDRAGLPRKRELRKHRRATDPVQRISDSCRTRVRYILSQAGIEKTDRTFALVGCTPNFFKSFLEAQFNRMMNWNNYGTYWEIDHIIAISKFDLENPEQRKRAFHYSNCRPLEVPSNRSKCDKSIGPHQALLI